MATRIAPLVFPPSRFVVPTQDSPASALDPVLEANVETGVAFTAYSTADHRVVLAERGTVGRFPRRRALAELAASDLPTSVRMLNTTWDQLHAGRALYLRAGDPGVLNSPDTLSSHAARPLWVSWDDLEQLSGSRQDAGAQLVHRTRLHHLDQGPERHGAQLAANQVDAVEFPFSDWTGGLTTLYHRFGIACVTTEASYQRELDAAFDMGIDAVLSSDGDALERSFATFFPA